MSEVLMWIASLLGRICNTYGKYSAVKLQLEVSRSLHTVECRQECNWPIHSRACYHQNFYLTLTSVTDA